MNKPNKDIEKVRKRIDELKGKNAAALTETQRHIDELQGELERLDVLIYEAADRNDADTYAERSLDRQRAAFKKQMFEKKLADLHGAVISDDEANELRDRVNAALSAEAEVTRQQALELLDRLNAITSELFSNATSGNQLLEIINRDLLHANGTPTTWSNPIIPQLFAVLRNPLYSQFLAEHGRSEELVPRAYG